MIIYLFICLLFYNKDFFLYYFVMENNNCTMKKIVRKGLILCFCFDKVWNNFLKTKNRSRYFGWWWDELKNKEEKKGKERVRHN